MEELGFIAKLALTGLIIFGIGFFAMIVYCVLGLEDIIDIDEPKWPRYIMNSSMGTGIFIMFLSLFLYIWS